ncbi:gamma-glutamyltransferase family protein [Kiloniella antarctica]|uniref:Gamma-glutamyltransferase family protein n=1 Tax=Kiloniella antarctica TaxID=1550907 RepID=A0ABW5BQ32_9PROT
MSGFTTRPEIVGTFGVVTSTHWLATAAGMGILERGGNAYDAAVATGFALQVVEPHLNGPGGEVPIIVAPAGGPVKVINGQGPAPEKATLATYQALDLAVVPGSGLLSAVVPGAFDAWMLMLLDYGTMKLRDVLEYCIGFAEDGYPIVPNIAHTITSVKSLFIEEWPTSAKVYIKDGETPKAGQLFKNPEMAKMYRRIIQEAEAVSDSREGQIEAARSIWSEGFVAQAIDDFCRKAEVMDTSGRRNKALLNGKDMAEWSATYEEPLTFDYHGYTVCKTGPWGQGPVFLQQLALLKGFNLEALDEKSPDFVHLVTESAKLAFADREAFYGDPDFVDVPMDILLSETYNTARRALINETASLEIRPGVIPGKGGDVVVRLKGTTEEGKNNTDLGEPTVARFDDEPTPDDKGGAKGDTCHLDIIDKWGNMVSATPSGGWLQSSPVIPGLGFCLSNRAQMFWLDEKSPACIAPGKRPRTTLTPSLALKNGVPYMAFGTPGGDQQDQWSLHFFLRHVHFGLNLQEAIDAPGFQTAHFPSSFYPRECDPGNLALEGRFPQSTIDELKRRGHKVVVEPDWSLGRMAAASKEDGLLKAAANPRFMQGYAIGR